MAGKPPPEKQCTAGSKRRPGERCEAWAMGGKKTCYHHGGASPIGAGSPHFKDGTRSKAGAIFTGDALEHYEAARRDERYLELREDIAVLDTLIVEALKAARVGEGGALGRARRGVAAVPGGRAQRHRRGGAAGPPEARGPHNRRGPA